MQASTKEKKFSLKNYTAEQLQPVLIVGILIVLAVVFTLINPDFIKGANLHSILLTSVTVGIITIGQCCCKMADYFDMSVGMVASMGGLAAAFIIKATGSVGLALLGGLGVGLMCGALAGLLVAYLKMNAFITTFALQSAYRGIIYIFTDGFPQKMFEEQFASFTRWGQMRVFGFLQFPILVLIVAYVLMSLFMKYRKLGRSIYLVGGNQKCAHICGINVKAVQMFIFLVSGTMSVIAGMLYASRMQSASAFLGETIPMESIAACIVGGTVGGHGNLLLTFVGVMIIFVVKNGLIMAGLPDFYQYIAIGLIIFLAVLAQVDRKKT